VTWSREKCVDGLLPLKCDKLPNFVTPWIAAFSDGGMTRYHCRFVHFCMGHEAFKASLDTFCFLNFSLRMA
jgi:hypothetical protein